MNNEDLEKYAIKYLDNGGKYEDIPKKNKNIRKTVEKEQKRRYMVYIRYGMLKSKKYSQDILDDPNKLYNELDKLSFEKIKNLQKNILHDSKKKK